MGKYLQSCLNKVVVVGIAAALPFGGLGTAEADTPSASVAASASASAVTVALPPAANICQDPPCTPPGHTIRCVVRVEDPVLANDRVWARGDVDCTDPVARIYLVVDLERNGSVVATRERQVQGQASATADTVKRCSPGRWKATANAWIVPPPGYTSDPPDGHIWKSSFTIDIVSPICPILTS